MNPVSPEFWIGLMQIIGINIILSGDNAVVIADRASLPEIAAAADGIEDEDLIEREDMVVTVTMQGYIKRTPLDAFRGGRIVIGIAGMPYKCPPAPLEFVFMLENSGVFTDVALSYAQKKEIGAVVVYDFEAYASVKPGGD